MLLLLLPVVLPAQTETEESVLFISSSPIKAGIRINGIPQLDTTPAMIRGLGPGTYVIEIGKQGYNGVTESVLISDGEINILDVKLEGFFFNPLFPSNERIIVNSSNIFENDTKLTIPNGTYSIRQESESLFIDPVYPNQGLMTALHISIPVLAVISGLLTVDSILNPRNTGTGITAAAWTSYVVTAGMIALDIGLGIHKERFLRGFPVTSTQSVTDFIAASQIYQKGEDMLARDRFNEALDYYTSIITGHEDSSYFPLALYKIARIHFILGEYDLSIEELKMIQRSYPLPELYDKACKNIADIYFFTGVNDKSRAYLDEMVFIDPLYSRESIDFYKSQILERQYQEAGEEDVLTQVIEAYVELIARYPESENLGQYQYLHANYLFFAGRYEESLNLLNSIESGESAMIETIEGLKREIITIQTEVRIEPETETPIPGSEESSEPVEASEVTEPETETLVEEPTEETTVEPESAEIIEAETADELDASVEAALETEATVEEPTDELTVEPESAETIEPDAPGGEEAMVEPESAIPVETETTAGPDEPAPETTGDEIGSVEEDVPVGEAEEAVVE